MRLNSFARITRNLSQYDSKDLLASLAGLQLVPENADRALRFEVLIHIVTSIRRKGFGKTKHTRISKNKLTNLCKCESSPDLYYVTRLEDPCENPFTEFFTYHGGSYIVFPSIFENATFILQNLAKAIFHSQSTDNSQFSDKAHEVFRLILILSDLIAKRANISRNKPSIFSVEKKVLIPSDSQISILKNAVLFDRYRIEHILNRYQISNSIFQRFVTKFGTVNLNGYEIDKGKLIARPIIEIEGQYIVSIPGALLTAARNAIISLALKYNVREELSESYNTVVAMNVVESLGFLKHQHTYISPPNSPEMSYFKDTILNFDIDKYVYVAIVTDDFKNYDKKEPLGQWSIDNSSELNLDKRIEEAYRFAFTELYKLSKFGVSDLVIIIVTQGIGRSLICKFENPPNIDPFYVLTISAADLRTITYLEYGKPLFIYKYLTAKNVLNRSSSLLSPDELNTIFYYRENDYSFYHSDEYPSPKLALGLGGTGTLRQEAIDKFNFHAVNSWDRRFLVEVGLRFADSSIPIYAQKNALGDGINKIAYLVKELPYLTWIVSKDLEEIESPKLIGIYKHLSEMIAYWLWQFTPVLQPIFNLINIDSPTINIQLNLIPNENWYHFAELEDIFDTEAMQVVVDKLKGVLYVTMSYKISRWLNSADNSGERQIIEKILLGIRQILPEEKQKLMSDIEIQKILDRYAPLGVKKYSLSLATKTNPELDAGDLPLYRIIQPADENLLLDELGLHLNSVVGLKKGEIPKDQRTKILEKAVEFYYGQLEELAASLNPEGLLENLIAYNEAIIYKLAEIRLTLPTRAACFNNEEEVVDELKQVIPNQNQAAIACRFVIEYVVAVPPSGIRPFSLSVYDRLLAISSQIVNLGSESDLIHFQLVDSKYEILGSGRLGRDHSEFAKARKKFLSIHVSGDIVRANDYFGTH